MPKRITINCDECQKDLISFYFTNVNDYWVGAFDIICEGCRDIKKLKEKK